MGGGVLGAGEREHRSRPLGRAQRKNSHFRNGSEAFSENILTLYLPPPMCSAPCNMLPGLDPGLAGPHFFHLPGHRAVPGGGHVTWYSYCAQYKVFLLFWGCYNTDVVYTSF